MNFYIAGNHFIPVALYFGYKLSAWVSGCVFFLKPGVKGFETIITQIIPTQLAITPPPQTPQIFEQRGLAEDHESNGFIAVFVGVVNKLDSQSIKNYMDSQQLPLGNTVAFTTESSVTNDNFGKMFQE